MSESYEKKWLDWRVETAKAEGAYEAVEKIRKLFIKVYGYEACESGSYYELMDMADEAHRLMITPEPAEDEEFNVRW